MPCGGGGGGAHTPENPFLSVSAGGFSEKNNGHLAHSVETKKRRIQSQRSPKSKRELNLQDAIYNNRSI